MRDVVRSSADDLHEEIKWNAPSYRHGNDHKITLGIERKGGVRIVLHRGVAAKDASGILFDDTAGVARWPASDRGVAVFADAAAVEAKRRDLGELIGRWIVATA